MTSSTQGIPPDSEQVAERFVALCNVIARLRSPEGCPWDREQTMKTIKPFTLEETYELLEAIDSDDNEDIQEELGDVLLQVVLDSQIAADEGRFSIVQVLEGITNKMISRHPHVFGDAVAHTAAEVRKHWEQAKNKEKKRESIFDGIPADLPALARAARITKKAAAVGYDFPQREMLFDKFREEVTEFLQELYPDGSYPNVPAHVDMDPIPDTPINDPALLDRIEGELGDILFVVANVCRRWGVNPEEALRRSNAKFSSRFQSIERGLAAQGRTPAEATLAEMEVLYQQRKQEERSDQGSGFRGQNI
ncbi:MAG TPA: nucleoside triphosphate pyrophosphohydrolase [Planctomicrobium sp.]|nr:nucleoside triphosphate pyrophosphohydrolase [Planctomicrobium sp.]